MKGIVVLVVAIFAAHCRGQVNTALTLKPGEALQLTGFGAGLSPSLLPPLWSAEGIYIANHSARTNQWRHSTRPSFLLTYEPITAGPSAPRRWLVLDLGQNEHLLTGAPPVAELPVAGPRPWERRGRGWRARDCTGALHETAAHLIDVSDRRQWDTCSTLTWRLTGLGERHPSLELLAGHFRTTGELSSGAPVYRAIDAEAVLQRVVSGMRSSWVLHSPRDSEAQLAALEDFADRINLIRTERFVASKLPGQDFLDDPAFVCAPTGWESGDADFTLPDLDGYKAIDDLNAGVRWSRQRFTPVDTETYRLAFGNGPEQHARMLTAMNVTDTRAVTVNVSLVSPRVYLTSAVGCALFRLYNDGFQLKVTLLGDDGRRQDLMKTSSIAGWRDLVVPLPGSGHISLTASSPDDHGYRFAVSQVLVFNESCDALQGRASACDDDTCLHGGTCTSVTIKHHLCLCPPGFVGARCQTLVDCGRPAEIPFGRVTHVSGTRYLDRAYYTCLSGYAADVMTFGVSWSVCHHNGSWVGVPRCQPETPRPYIECDFSEDCPDFNSRTDNAYNTDTDQEWTRSEHLKTSNIRPQGAFLTTYRATGRRTITSRLRTPCLDLQATGCLRMDVYLRNATLSVWDWRMSRELFDTKEGGRGLLVPLQQETAPLLVVVRLMPGESEAALDTIRVYRHACDQLRQMDRAGGADGQTWPTWRSSGQTDTEDTARASAGQATPILLVLVPLAVLLGLCVALRCSKPNTLG